MTAYNSAPIAVQLGDTAALEVDLAIYSSGTVLRAAYRFTDRCYVFLAHAEDEPQRIVVTLTPKDGDPSPRTWIGELSNELLDQQLREDLGREAQLQVSDEEELPGWVHQAPHVRGDVAL